MGRPRPTMGKPKLGWYLISIERKEFNVPFELAR